MSNPRHLRRAAFNTSNLSCRSVGRVAYVGLLITAMGAIELCGGRAAHSRPCTVQIAQLERQIRLAAPTGSQTLGAQLHYQPTPADVQNAESRASANANAALQRARQADADGDPVVLPGRGQEALLEAGPDFGECQHNVAKRTIVDGLSNHPERLGRVKIRGATGHPNIFKAPVTETHPFAARSRV
jgi:hypothetical protein